MIAYCLRQQSTHQSTSAINCSREHRADYLLFTNIFSKLSEGKSLFPLGGNRELYNIKLASMKSSNTLHFKSISNQPYRSGYYTKNFNGNIVTKRMMMVK